jgi:hypothetical protein
MLDGSTETKYGELEVDVLCSVLNCRSVLAKDVDSQRYDHSRIGFIFNCLVISAHHTY